jgi:hypothetical protein
VLKLFSASQTLKNLTSSPAAEVRQVMSCYGYPRLCIPSHRTLYWAHSLRFLIDPIDARSSLPPRNNLPHMRDKPNTRSTPSCPTTRPVKMSEVNNTVQRARQVKMYSTWIQ